MAKNKDLIISKIFDIQESIVGDDIQDQYYFRAVEESDVPTIDEILNNKIEYKDAFDNKDEINARFLLGGMYVLSGKTGVNYLTFGGYFDYFDKHKKWKELGDYEKRSDFFKDRKNLPFSENYSYKAEKVYELYSQRRLKYEEVIKLGNRATLLPDYILDDLTNNELTKLIKKILKMSGDDAAAFLRSGDYKYYLAGEKLPMDQKTIPLSGSDKEASEYIQLNIKLPSVRSSEKPNGIGYLDFGNDDYRDISLLIIREWMKSGDFQTRLNDKLNQPEYENYLKKLRKLAETNKVKKI